MPSRVLAAVDAYLTALITYYGFLSLFPLLVTARLLSLLLLLVLAEVGWQVVQILGTYFLTHALRAPRRPTASSASCSASSPGSTSSP